MSKACIVKVLYQHIFYLFESFTPQRQYVSVEPLWGETASHHPIVSPACGIEGCIPLCILRMWQSPTLNQINKVRNLLNSYCMSIKKGEEPTNISIIHCHNPNIYILYFIYVYIIKHLSNTYDTPVPNIYSIYLFHSLSQFKSNRLSSAKLCWVISRCQTLQGCCCQHLS